MDGVGKSTLVDALVQKIPASKAANIWDLLDSPIQSLPFKSKHQIDDFLCALTPDSRLLFLSHALTYSVDKALEGEAECIILNSYYYKYFATEYALGANIELVKALSTLFPAPDLVIKLELPVAESLLRKKVLSRYECGLVSKPDSISFSTFQNKATNAWDLFDPRDWIKLDARKSPTELLNDCIQTLKDSSLIP